MGMGIGIIIATTLMSAFGNKKDISREELERRAREELKMDYPDNFKVINKGVGK